MTEQLTWLPTLPRPDADTTFLLNAPDSDEPVWPGYWDGAEWLWADGTPAEGVTAYAEMPKGGGA